MAILEKRTKIVLGALVGAMAVTSTLLLCLEPKPVGPRTHVLLTAYESHRAPEDTLFDTNPEVAPGRWRSIVIHQSGTPSGNAQTLDQYHRQLGLMGVGYHFVVGNGKGAPEGQIEMSFRWRRQLAGAHSSGPSAAWYNQHAIGICLVGDTHEPHTPGQMRQLVWLVRELQDRLQIPADHVLVQIDGGNPSSANAFPTAEFRRQLLASAER